MTVLSITTMDEFIQIADKVMDIISIVISSIAAISLVVGGIGIMNIMLVTVRERTREVGIRKAVGATRQNILYQFLTESLMLCLFGGIIGIGAAAGIILLIAKVMDVAISLSGGAILLGFTFSCLVGIFFGVYPAHLAAKLNPVEALRYSITPQHLRCPQECYDFGFRIEDFYSAIRNPQSKIGLVAARAALRVSHRISRKPGFLKKHGFCFSCERREE